MARLMPLLNSTIMLVSLSARYARPLRLQSSSTSQPKRREAQPASICAMAQHWLRYLRTLHRSCARITNRSAKLHSTTVGKAHPLSLEHVRNVSEPSQRANVKYNPA